MSKYLRIPGMVDPHVHLRDLEWAHKATFASETAAALAGGYWAILDMPNTPPSTIDHAALELKLDTIQHQAVCDWGLYFGASQGGNQAEYAGVFSQVCGLKIYCNATTGTLLVEDQALREAHFAAWPVGKPIAVHAEGDTVAEILELVRKFHKPTHFCHISTAYEIYLLRLAKEEGLPVTVGVTPHHLYLDEDDARAMGSLGLMKPLLKTKADQQALWQAISDEVVDVIESDHAPHALIEKYSANPPYGVPGLETTLPLMALAVADERLSVERLVDLVAINPQRIFGLTPPPDTYTLVDLHETYVIDNANMRTLCGWSPFDGIKVHGRVMEVWVRGQYVFDGENVLVEAGFGQNVAATSEISQ
ncbi:MAG: amidohydrolase family protein [Chloroflexi bacterium]|nr:amidohydrolase family protein [Chloroflexota bacterium]